MDSLRCSIIINTYNRAPYLRRLLPGLAQLRGAEFEVVVVNGPSNDGTQALLEEYRGRIKLVDCPTRNLSHSRNLGIAAAAGEIVVFIDDDALPEDPHWLARYVAAFSGPGSADRGAAGGPVRHGDTCWLEFNGGATSDYGFQIFDADKLGQVKLDGQRWLLRVQGCNCAFRRSALVKVGGFDEFFIYYHDETDICLRLARAGWHTQHLPENGVRHYAAGSERRTSKYDRNWRVVARSDAYFGLKNGADRLPLRLGKTLAGARRKHYVGEINSYLLSGEISVLRWLRLTSQWQRGAASGVWAGLRRSRQLARLDAQPPAFLPFLTSTPAARLRVALLTQSVPGQPGYGGIGRYTFDLARGLHERGHEVHLICKDEQPLRYESLGFVIHGIAAADCLPQPVAPESPVLNKNSGYSLAVVQKLAELYAEGVEFDLVHASNWDCEAAALIRAQLYPTALMLVSPLAQVVDTEQWQLNDDLRRCIALDRWQIEHADTVCVPSEGVLKSYRDLMGVEPAGLACLRSAPLGIVPAAPSLAEIRRAGERRRLLFVGRCERRKGAHILLDALPELLAAHPDWECHLVGNDQVPLAEGGTLKSQFLERQRGAPWLSRVIFHGSVAEAELQQHYQRCDLFVAPSLFESFGLIYHEAMQYGKPVVGCSTGGVPETVAHGVEGLLVPPGQAAALRDALAQLMGDAGLRERMGAAGRRRVYEECNYRTMAARLEQIYGETIAVAGPVSRRRRRQLWPRRLPLLEAGAALGLHGEWPIRSAAPGQIYRVGNAGDALSFNADGATTLRLVALRHDWSGVLEVRTGDTLLRYIDLFKPGQLELAYTVDVPLGSAGQQQHSTITLCVHTERNPASHASQVWLKQIALDEHTTAPCQPGHDHSASHTEAR